jgi:UDP-N-acetylglucosamine 2-epimerase (non-hydrolysing)
MIRQAHERPEGMDEGVVIMCGLKERDVIDAIDIVSISSKHNQRRLRLVEDYDVDDVSKKVLHIIMSYIGYINRVVWRK